jgi:hypothetical protein
MSRTIKILVLSVSLVILFIFSISHTEQWVGEALASPSGGRLKSPLPPLGERLLCFIFSISHTGEKSDILPEGNQMASKPIAEVLKEHTKSLMTVPGVVGTGQGLCEGKPCIKVFVIKKTPELEQKIPETLEGYPVVIEETGEIKALPRTKNGSP